MPSKIVAHPYNGAYTVSYYRHDIFTTVTSSPGGVRPWITNVTRKRASFPYHLIVGFDLVRGPSEDHIGNLRLCVGPICLVYQIFRAESYPQCLSDFLTTAEGITFVGVGMRSKLEMLQRENVINRAGKVRYVDLGELTAEWYHRPDLNNAGVSELATYFFKKDVVEEEKPKVGGDWDQAELSLAQVQCACIDALFCFQLGWWMVRN